MQAQPVQAMPAAIHSAVPAAGVNVAPGLGLTVPVVTTGNTGPPDIMGVGKTGLEVSILGLGGARIGMLLDNKVAVDVVRRCYDLGVNYFDAAAAGFKKTVELHPGDGPAQFYLAQISHLEGQKLPEDWTGEIDLKEK